MLKTILAIILSVSIFGIVFFIFVKRSIKKTIDYYVESEKKKKRKKIK